MQIKFKDAAEVFESARLCDPRIDVLRAQRDKANADIALVIEDRKTLHAAIGKIIEHNDRKPILDGDTLWLGPIQGCNDVTQRTAILASAAKLPDDMRVDAEPEIKVGQSYRIFMDHVSPPIPDDWVGVVVQIMSIEKGLASGRCSDGYLYMVTIRNLKPLA